MPPAQVDITTQTPVEVDVLHATKLHSLKSSSTTSAARIPSSLTNAITNNNAKAQVATAAEGFLKPAASPKRRLGHERKKSDVKKEEEKLDVRKLAIRSAGGDCNRPGLNGLLGNGVEGLSSGVFKVAAVMPVQYDVEIVNGILEFENKTLLRAVDTTAFPTQLNSNVYISAQNGKKPRRFLAVDSNILTLYGEKIRKYFDHHQIDTHIYPVIPDEFNKDHSQIISLCASLQAFNLDRRSEPIIAIGGGVTLDLVGLAANLYRRNTPVIKLPTTLIGMVDAAVGVKTACNLNGGKNKIGTYSAPLAVFVDAAFLGTLPGRHVRNGAAEVLKMACVKDGQLFELLEGFVERGGADGEGFEGKGAQMIMRRAIQGMLEELEPNLWEFNLRRIVDYGHTFSPVLEMCALESHSGPISDTTTPGPFEGGFLLHGEAVCVDMAFTTVVAKRRGYLSEEEARRTLRLMRGLGLNVWHRDLTGSLCKKALIDTTACRGGFQRTPLMDGIGRARFVDDLTLEELEEGLKELEEFARRDFEGC
ncbi:hypothetical protein HK097_006865 [Rhizophlyctis rosea]|uniref:2-epi-5-epi-valiolone synthase n=1 Tax=Rhizophlyctis rosea TaxID=64517 RepID=A0AAD5SK79_9FUNG|nr:hypothetical protein HK097_006865 [Rhizophlyctis rosea]